MAIPSNSRLTQPLIRENGGHRPASWDEALDRVAQGFRGAVEKHGPQTFGMFSCSKTTNELNYHGPEVRALGDRQQQYRQLQPDLTRPQRRRSGDGLWGGRRHQFLPRDRRNGRHSALGVERAGDASDLLPSLAEGGAQRGAALRRGSAAHVLGAMGRCVAGPRRRFGYRAGQRHGA